MNSVFISGIPASGKSCLAEKIAKKLNIIHIEMDNLREEMSKDQELKKWVEFFSSQDETRYWNTTNCKQHLANLKEQAEAFWHTYEKKISEIISSGKTAIFEGVSILPHLASQYLRFSGIYLVSDSVEEIFSRNNADPRWGKTEELQMKEAEVFVNCETVMYERDAKSYGYKVFRDPQKAEEEVIKLLKG